MATAFQKSFYCQFIVCLKIEENAIFLTYLPTFYRNSSTDVCKYDVWKSNLTLKYVYLITSEGKYFFIFYWCWSLVFILWWMSWLHLLLFLILCLPFPYLQLFTYKKLLAFCLSIECCSCFCSINLTCSQLYSIHMVWNGLTAFLFFLFLTDLFYDCPK